MGQIDIHADGLCAKVISAPVCRLHNARAASGHYDDAAAPGILSGAGYQTAELACNFVVAALGQDTFPYTQPALQQLIGGVFGKGLAQHSYLALSSRRLGNPGTAEDNDGMANPMLFEEQLRFKIIKLKAQSASVIPV